MAGEAGGRLLVVDDDVALRRMLDRTLRAEGFDVDVVPDGGAALASVERSMPELIVLDVRMPGVDGISVCRRLRAKGLAVPILMLTARDAVADRVAGLEAGADDYLVKPFATEELIARIRALTRRTSRVAERLAIGELTLDLVTRTARRGAVVHELTSRESALLETLMRRPRQVMTREQALEEIWRGEAAPNVVDRYVARLRVKLGNPPLIHTVRGVGFMLQA